MGFRVLALVGDMDACSMWRVLQPYTELQRQGMDCAEWGRKDDNRLADVVHVFDAVVIPRQHWPEEQRDKGDRWFNALHKARKAIIYEVDDDMFTDAFVKRLVDNHGYTWEYASTRRDCILHAMQACDGVTVSSQRLATIVREYTDRPVVVVENYIDLKWFRAVQRASERIVPGLTIGWAGGNRPDGDMIIMAEAWSRIAERHLNVTFVIQGHHTPALYDAVPKGRVASLDWLPIESYPAGLVNIDIGCCPLEDTAFNRAKTPIKAMEYAASGAAVVASPTIYGRVVDNGVNGFICRTADEWEDALHQLVEDRDLRRGMAKALLTKVRERHALEKNAWRWPEAWGEIINDFRTRQSRRIYLPSEVRYA